MAVIIVGLLGAVGYLGYQSAHTTTTIANTTTAQSASTQSTTPKIDLAEAKQLVNSFYSDYYKLLGTDSTGNENQKAVVEKYGTASLQAYFTNYQYEVDPVICAQNPPLSAPTVTAITMEDSNAVVTVQEKYEMQPDPVSIQLIVKGTTNPKIDSIKCPVFASN